MSPVGRNQRIDAVDSGSAVKGFAWSPRRLKRAVETVNRALAPLHARVAIRPDGELRLFTCRDDEIDKARQVYLRRRHAREPLSASAARIIWECLHASRRSGSAIGGGCGPEDDDRAVLYELLDAGYVVTTAGAAAHLAEHVRAALGVPRYSYPELDRSCG